MPGEINHYSSSGNLLKNPDPDNEEYQETIEWLGGLYEPKHFDCSEVFFGDPEERLNDYRRIAGFSQVMHFMATIADTDTNMRGGFDDITSFFIF